MKVGDTVRYINRFFEVQVIADDKVKLSSGYWVSVSDVEVLDMENEVTRAIVTVDEMLRKRKDKMQIMDCLAISEVLKDRAQLETRVAELEQVLRLANQYKLTTRLQRAVREILEKKG